jgi:hypothetical protein
LSDVSNPNAYDQAAYNRAAKRLHAAIAALWKAGASVQEIEDEIEEAMREVASEE